MNKKLKLSVYRVGVSVFLVLTLGILFYPVAQKYSQSFKFVDENEHMVMAWLLGKGYHLYTDFPNNHQPISYFVSYVTQQVFEVDNVFMLVKRHRDVIFAWSVLWWIILFRRFGSKVFLPLVIFENIKYFTLGNEFLAESLAVYPLAYLGANTLLLSQRKPTQWDNFWAGILTGVVQLTILPMAIMLGMMTLVRFIYLKGKGIPLFLLGFLLVLLGVFAFVDIRDYIVEVTNAVVYSVPGLSPVSSPWQSWRLIGLPILYIPFYKDPIGLSVLLMTAWWLVTLLIFIGKGKRGWFGLTAGTMVAWLVTNTRNVKADVYFYEAFHLTPWLLVGLLGGLIAFSQALALVSKKTRWIVFGLNGLVLLIFFSNRNLPLFTRIDPLTEHYVQYTPITQAAEKINALKHPGDRLMVIPNESLLYYMTDLDPAPTNMFTYYDWQVQVPKNRALFFQTLSESPPTFIVYSDDGSSYSPFMNDYLKENYFPLMQYPHVYISAQNKERIPLNEN